MWSTFPFRPVFLGGAWGRSGHIDATVFVLCLVWESSWVEAAGLFHLVHFPLHCRRTGAGTGPATPSPTPAREGG